MDNQRLVAPSRLCWNANCSVYGMGDVGNGPITRDDVRCPLPPPAYYPTFSTASHSMHWMATTDCHRRMEANREMLSSETAIVCSQCKCSLTSEG